MLSAIMEQGYHQFYSYQYNVSNFSVRLTNVDILLLFESNLIKNSLVCTVAFLVGFL